MWASHDGFFIGPELSRERKSGPMSVVAFLALGANLGNPRDQLDSAVDRLREAGLGVERRAPIYRSKPLGPAEQPDFLNTVLEVRTDLEPFELLDLCLGVENEMGRVRAVRWGPRVVDIDIALYGETIVDHPRLRIPHPELHRRRFVLAPLADLAPDACVPGQKQTVRELLRDLSGEPSDLIVVDPRVLAVGVSG